MQLRDTERLSPIVSKCRKDASDHDGADRAGGSDGRTALGGELAPTEPGVLSKYSNQEVLRERSQ